MHWTVLLIGLPNEETEAYLKKYDTPHIISKEECNPFYAHTKYPGYDFILCWKSNVYPRTNLGNLAIYLDFTKINVTWDSEGRNYPHKTRRRFSEDFLGIPHSAKHANLELLEMETIHILPKTWNVSEGYVEYDQALLINKKKTQSKPVFLKTFDPVSGKYI